MASQEKQIKICRTTLKILKYNLIWPKEDEEMNPGKWYYIRFAAFLLITSLLVLPVFMHTFMTIKNNIDISISEELAGMLAFGGLYYMTIIYVKNQSKVAFLLRDLSNFEKFGLPPGFDQEEKKLSFCAVFLNVYYILGVSFYNVVKILEIGDCEKMNEEKGLEEICGIMISIWFPFKINGFPLYHIVFLYVFLSTQLLMKMGLLISYNCLEIGHHLILRINHLNIMIRECFDDKNYEISRKKLNICISYHSDILELSARLDDCFSKDMFAHLTMTAAICGFLEKQYVDNSHKFGAVIHISGWIMALFIACLGGQHVINSGNSIPEAIWSSKWYQVDTRLQKDLIFMLLRSQKEIYVSAGAFGIMAFPLFVSVMKMSYSILAVLTS